MIVMHKMIGLLIMSVLLLSGCTGNISTGPGNTVSGNEKTDHHSSDLVTIERFDAIPSTELTPGRTFELYLEVYNSGEDPIQIQVNRDGEDGDGDAIIKDYCDIFEPINFRSSRNIDDEGKITLNPESRANFRWKIRAPSSKDISQISNALSASCQFSANIKYDAESYTDSYVYFATPYEISRSIYTRKNMHLLGTNIATDGPLKININTPSEQPIPMGEWMWDISVNMENLGDGLVMIDSLDLILPDGIAETADAVTKDNKRREVCDFDSQENLEIRSSEGSQPIECTLKPLYGDFIIATAFKVRAKAEYTYLLQDVIEVTVEQ